MHHKCEVKEEDSVLDNISARQKLNLVSKENPRHLAYFKSEASVREEQRRQLKIDKHVIHPFSKFKVWYDIYLLYLYSSLLITKPVEAGFLKAWTFWQYPLYRYYSIFTDLLSFADIGLKFYIGFNKETNGFVELESKAIAKRYALSLYFWCDVLSSIPKPLMFAIPQFPHYYRKYVFGILNVLGFLKIVRVVTLVKCIKRTADYLRIMSKGLIFLVCSMAVSLVTFHWMACLQFAVPRLARRTFFTVSDNSSWFIKHHIYYESLVIQYSHAFFKSSANILCIRLNIYTSALPEEIGLALITYVIGKILIAFIWIILAIAILNSRTMDIKFAEVVNQLEEYMRQRQLPLDLRNKILQYFKFKYQNQYFKEGLITSMLSENLKKDVNMHVCKSLIENVSLFSDLTSKEISEVVEFLIPEIFLPNDIITQSGSFGDAMYFLSNGTVAIYTRSGKEICHVHDGAYFGELALVFKSQVRVVTCVAIETSHVYRLNKKCLEKCLLSNKSVRSKLMRNAELRLKNANRVEESYKKLLFERSYHNIAQALE